MTALSRLKAREFFFIQLAIHLMSDPSRWMKIAHIRSGAEGKTVLLSNKLFLRRPKQPFKRTDSARAVILAD